MTKNKKACPHRYAKHCRRGFTLIELLIVIAIIGILASVVMVRLQSARDKAQEASAKSSAKSVLSILVECKNDGGEAAATPVGGDFICCEDDTCAAAKAGYEDKLWPDVSTKLGYSYDEGTVTGTVDGEDYSFQLTKTGQNTVICSMTKNNCE
jgi:prepilin-type N-terminal cleavage/methylation domain-containing protein